MKIDRFVAETGKQILALPTRASRKTRFVAIDGPSGVGKTYFTKLLQKSIKTQSRSLRLPLDDFLVPEPKFSALKKAILGEGLSRTESLLLNDTDISLISPGEECRYEFALFWRYQDISRLLQLISEWSDNGQDDVLSFFVNNPWSRDRRRLLAKAMDLHPGTILFVDGKFSLADQFRERIQYDCAIRILASPQIVRQQYKERKAAATSGCCRDALAKLDRSIKFYDIMMSPSWDSYSRVSLEYVTLLIDLRSREL